MLFFNHFQCLKKKYSVPKLRTNYENYRYTVQCYRLQYLSVCFIQTGRLDHTNAFKNFVHKF